MEKKLQELQETNQYFYLSDIKKWTSEILNGLANMHDSRIIHRDLKPENILLKNGHVKICDFGSSKFYDEVNHKNTPYVVSRYYRAPELILSSPMYDESIDIWGKNSALIVFSCWLHFV